jgi:glycosyltransferase involved in cell wall biosynthesis
MTAARALPYHRAEPCHPWWPARIVPAPAPPPRRHIAFFMHGFEMGGAQKMTIALASSLAAAGHRVDLVVARAAGPLHSSVPASIKVIELPSVLPFADRWARRARVRAAVPGLVAYLRRESPDVLIGGANHASLATAVAHRLAGSAATRLVLRATNPLERRGLAPWAKRVVARAVFAHAAAIVPVSLPLAEDHARVLGGEARLRVIPEPIVDPRFGERLAAPPFHPWLNEEAPLVVTIGRLVAQKDQALLLEAFAAVRAIIPDCRLMVIGDGPKRAALVRLAVSLGLADAVHFAGTVDNPLPALARAGCLALSSRWEGLGIAAVEALAAGCPVAATDTPALRWVLRGGAFGRLVPVGGAAALADAIVTTLIAPPPRANLARRAREFDSEAVAAAYAALIEAVCDGQASHAPLHMRRAG